MMWRRIRQFVAACKAEITPADEAFTSDFLNPVEKSLFDRLDAVTAKHSINTARTVLRLAQSYNLSATEKQHAVKGALLHDIGKSLVKITKFYKVFYVLLGRFLFIGTWKPPHTIAGVNKFLYTMYVAKNHAKLGADLAEKAGLDSRLVRLILYHHAENSTDPIINIIREADELN
ncbi:HDIG domain-containing metalloprotein [Thermincola potens]|uniref:Metal dependent phosphohydrolase n=1 Tax=Thermincola potens (strain JR) TaxID=635013 RepID=D5XEU4_THEPJ|nr:HDIG domain-containing metalloprotein [Thermincola potens]ADG82165.1 metal dependent phosphohydrolase [Thermincola potens JR]